MEDFMECESRNAQQHHAEGDVHESTKGSIDRSKQEKSKALRTKRHVLYMSCHLSADNVWYCISGMQSIEVLICRGKNFFALPHDTKFSKLHSAPVQLADPLGGYASEVRPTVRTG